MMKPEDIGRAVAGCIVIIERAFGGNTAKPTVQRLNDTEVLAGEYMPRDRASHLLYMCQEIGNLIAEQRHDKVMRWLGFVQGALWAHNWATIEELKRLNMPEGPH